MKVLICETLIIFLILIFNGISNCNGQASKCPLQKTNSPDQCKPVKKCPSVYNKMRRGINDYAQCTSSRKEELVVRCPPRLHEQKCQEYQQHVCKKAYIAKLSLHKPLPIENDECGFKSIKLVSGGENAGPKEFPHMASLGYRVENRINFQMCGGSLISERFILTAAHCMRDSDPEIVRLGDLNINSNDDDGFAVDISVQEIIIHPNFTSNTKRNDIALIKLAKNVTFDEYKRPACLPSERDWNDNNAMVTGWGHTSSYDTYGTDHLQKAKVQKFTKNECQEILNNTKTRNNKIYKVSYKRQVCAGSKTDERDSCPGDSGGPLQILNSKLYCMWNIVGITSFGPTRGCGLQGIPGIYTRVFHYIDWIESIVWNN